MPIIDVQRRLHEAGRIRIGAAVPIKTKRGTDATRPTKLDSFRFTSRSKDAITALARIHGGTASTWDGAPVGQQWEVVTEATSLRVIAPPERMGFSQFYELWSGGGCLRRCDGEHQLPSEDQCVCDPEARECRPHTRLSLLLADLPSSGLWRLDTQGWNAAAELAGGFELATLLARTSGRTLLGATLRLEQRETRRPGEQVRCFAVPVMDFDLDEAIARPALSPVPPDAPRSLASQMAEVEHGMERPQRANGSEPVRRTGLAVRTAAQLAAAPIIAEGEIVNESTTEPGAPAVTRSAPTEQAREAVGEGPALSLDPTVKDYVSAMTARQLNDELRAQGLQLGGTKAEMQERLLAHLGKDEAQQSDEATEPVKLCPQCNLPAMRDDRPCAECVAKDTECPTCGLVGSHDEECSERAF